MKSLMFLLSCGLVWGCAGSQFERPQCPESRSLGCLTEPVCHYDTGRDCQVCACEEVISPHQRDPLDEPER
jgi:hypothetical protein